jgi:hypothetical protein
MEKEKEMNRKDKEAFIFADVIGFVALSYSLWILSMECSMDELISALAILMFIIVSIFVFLLFDKKTK